MPTLMLSGQAETRNVSSRTDSLVFSWEGARLAEMDAKASGQPLGHCARYWQLSMMRRASVAVASAIS